MIESYIHRSDRLVFPPGVRKGMVKYLWKRALSHEKGTLTLALQYRGHFGNGAFLQQEHTDACFTLLFSFLQPCFCFLPLSLFSNPQHELVLPVTLIYKVFCRPTFSSIWLLSSLTPDYKQLVHREITPFQYQLSRSSTTPSVLHYTLPGHTKSLNFVHTSFNWFIGVTCKFWGIIIKTMSWLSDNKQRTESTIIKLYEIAWFITSAFNP